MKRLLLTLFLVAACQPGPTPTVAPSDTPSPITPSPTAVPGSPAPSTGPTVLPSSPVGPRLPGEPDPALTPGALNPAVTQTTIGSTICVSGWTATVRPPVSYTNAKKILSIKSYGYADTSLSSYEEDHLVPLELGGDPGYQLGPDGVTPLNLWAEPHSITASGTQVGSFVKDGLENKLKGEVCAGTLTLAQARADIGDNWVHVYIGSGQLVAPAPSADQEQ